MYAPFEDTIVRFLAWSAVGRSSRPNFLSTDMHQQEQADRWSGAGSEGRRDVELVHNTGRSLALPQIPPVESLLQTPSFRSCP